MKSVILAVESGVAETKPLALTPLLGRHLLERSLTACTDAGFKACVLVTPEQDERVRQVADRFAQQHHLTIEHVTVAPEGTPIQALLALQDELGDKPFVLMDIAYPVDQVVLKSLLHRKSSKQSVIAVDHHVSGKTFALGEILGVQCDNAAVTALSNAMELPQGYYTGVMLCAADFFKHLNTLISKRKVVDMEKLLQTLIREDALVQVDVGHHFWHKVHSYAQLRDAEAALLASVKRSRKDSLLKRHLLRPLSNKLTYSLVSVSYSVHAMAITAVGLACLAAILMSFSGYAGLLLGAVVGFAALLLHISTQEVAVIRQHQVIYDRWLGHILVKYSEVILLTGMTAHITTGSGHNFGLIGGLAIIGAMMINYSVTSYRHLHGKAPAKEQDVFLKRDVRWLIMLVCAAVNLPTLGLLILAVILNGVVIRRMVIWKH